MFVYAVPTEEIYSVPLKPEQREVPLRIYEARMMHSSVHEGIPVDLYVFSVVAKEEKDDACMEAMLPAYMQRTRDVHQIDLGRKPPHEFMAAIPEQVMGSAPCDHVIGMVETRAGLIFRYASDAAKSRVRLSVPFAHCSTCGAKNEVAP